MTLNDYLDLFRINDLAQAQMDTDIYETAEGYMVGIEAPGILKESIDVQTADGRLIVKGVKKRPEVGEGMYRDFQTFTGKFSNTIRIKGIDVSGITAEYVDGVIRVFLPKDTATLDKLKAKMIEVK